MENAQNLFHPPGKRTEAMLESVIERKLFKAVRDHGGMAYKFVSPGTAGLPDRLVLFPGRRIAFIELKAPGQKPRPLQLRRHEQLQQLGFPVHIIDHPDQIPGVINEIQDQ